MVASVAEDAKPARRQRRSSAVVEQLAALKGKRDELDAEAAERRRLEDAALERYAQAVARVQEINAERDRKADALMEQVKAAHEQAKVAVAAVEADQAAALAEVNNLGRSAEDLSALTGIPVKRVRVMLRSARRSATASEPAGDTPPARSGAAGSPAVEAPAFELNVPGPAS
jgi:DNA-directed RNA polymerase specialized sigma24 family protein